MNGGLDLLERNYRRAYNDDMPIIEVVTSLGNNGGMDYRRVTKYKCGKVNQIVSVSFNSLNQPRYIIIITYYPTGERKSIKQINYNGDKPSSSSYYEFDKIGKMKIVNDDKPYDGYENDVEIYSQ